MASRSVGSGSHSSGRGRSEVDEGDSKPPSISRPAQGHSDLRLNTPQAEEGPEQAVASGGVAVLPEPRAAETNKSAPTAPSSSPTSSASTSRQTSSPFIRASAAAASSESVIGWSEDGPIRASRSAEAPTSAARYVSPPRASPETAGRQGVSSPSATRATRPTAPSSSAARRSTSPNDNGGLAGNVAVGIPTGSTTGADTNEDKSSSSSGGISKKKLLIIGAILVAIVVAVVVVVVVVVGGNNNDPAPASDTGDSASPPPPVDGSPTSAPAGGKPILTLATVAQRGSLKCGISMQQGFGSITNGEYEGFDVDLVSTGSFLLSFCRFSYCPVLISSCHVDAQ